jgi:endonuclease/exonuclease/phosphatase family metal-dependent hydrolase
MKGIGLVLLLGAFLITGSAQEATNTFRVMTYNIHHGEGPDGKVDLGRIASAIKAEKADIVALQEVDRGTLRTRQRDLTAELAKLTGMNSKGVIMATRS